MSVDLEDWSWPPPGLERMHGVLRTAARRGATSTVLVGVPLLWLVTADRIETGDATDALLGIALMVGLFAYLGAILRAAAALDLARRGARLGYSRAILLDVLASRHDDTPALIAGTGAYADLRPRIRDTMRALRRTAALTALAGGLLPLPLLCLGIWLALRGAASALSVALLLIAPALLLWIATALLRGYATLLAQWERGAAAWDPAPISERDRADEWRARFAPDDTRTPRPTGLLALTAVAGSGIVAFVFLFVTVAITGVLADWSNDSLRPSVQLDAPNALRLEAIRALRTPTDSSITPDSAGRALHAYLAAADDSLPGMLPTEPLPPLWSHPVRTSHLGLWRALNSGDVAPNVTALRDAPAHPALAALHTLARAAAVDPLTARWGDRVPAAMIWYRDADVPPVVLRPVADAANAWRRGDREQARAILRDLLSAGLLLVDHGRTRADLQIGVAMAFAGADLLGDPTAAALDSLAERADERTARPTARDVPPMRLVHDTDVYPALRWEALRVLQRRERCGAPSGLLFAPDTLWRAQAARALLRSRGDSLAFASLLDQAPPLARGSRWYGRIERGVRAVTGQHLLQNPCFAPLVRGY